MKRTKEQISKNMKAVKSKNTKIELKLRKTLWHLGFRYRKNYNKLPGKPDMVFIQYKIAIFCDSAFWHGYKNLKTKRHDFKSNIEFWEKKIKRNIKRDIEVNELLEKMGWEVLRFWDFEINNDIDKCIGKIIRKINNKKKTIVVDFFSGCGGVSFGLKESGLEILAGLDNKDFLKYSYEKNIKNANYYKVDLTEVLKTRKILEDIILKNVKSDFSIFSACAPCQPFSLHKKNYKNDERISLMEIFIKIVESLKEKNMPTMLFVENVGTMKKRGKDILNRIVKKLKLLGYTLMGDKPMVLNFSNFGVPQNRRRLIFIAAKRDRIIKSIFNWDYFKRNYSENKKISVKEAFENYEKVYNKKLYTFSANDEKKIKEIKQKDYLQVTQKLSKKNLTRLSKITKTGGNRDDYWDESDQLNCYKNHKGHKDVYSRMHYNKPAPTLTCKFISISNGRFGHPDPKQNRALTLREGLILQTMEKFDFKKPIKKTKVARQIGNAVPSKIAKKFGLFFKEILI